MNALVLKEGQPFNPYNLYHGVFIPSGLIESTINDSVKILMGRLLQYSGKNGKAYPYRSTLAKECGWEIRKLDRIIRKAKSLKLIKTTPHITENPVDNPPNEYIFLYSKIYNSTDKNNSTPTDKNVEQNKIIKNKIIKKRFINKSNDSGESSKQSKPLDQESLILQKLRKNKKLKIIKKPKDEKIVPKPKYKHTINDERNYIELINKHGATDHRSEKAKNKTLDKLHALLSKNCNNPFDIIDIPKKYTLLEWDIDLLIEVFDYHMQNFNKFNKNKIKSIGAFIFSEGYNGFESWSPLLWWHQKMTENKYTEEGQKFLSSLKRYIPSAINLDPSIINKVAKEAYSIIQNYILIDGKTVSMECPNGIIDVLSKFIKEKTNNTNFKLVYITKNGFVDEFVEEALKRRFIKLKLNGRKAYNLTPDRSYA